MARDVRKFVQSFNMSRQFAEEQRLDETLIPLQEETNTQPPSNRKRTDWSEYIDPEENDHDGRFKDDQDQDYVFEEKIVTELPKALFKRPKLNTYSSGLGTEDGEKGFKPVFPKRNPDKDKELRKSQPTTAYSTFKPTAFASQNEEDFSADMKLQKTLLRWRTSSTQEKDDIFPESMQNPPTAAKGSLKKSDCLNQEKIEDLTDEVPWRCQSRKMKGASKWDEYIIGDDDDNDEGREKNNLQLKIGREFADEKGHQWDNGEFEATLYDRRVEEEVHPDFQ
ncbi:hypothetical protein U1Q18_051960 [Sarracenia purpurea var. burkii]